MTANLIQITPFIHVPDTEQAVAFFSDILGFSCRYYDPDVCYAYLERDGVAIRLLQNRGDEGAPPGNRRYAYYVDVRDVDALLDELSPKLAQLALEDVHGPIDQPYGQRELLIRAPDGNLIVFGQPIRPRPEPAAAPLAGKSGRAGAVAILLALAAASPEATVRAQEPAAPPRSQPSPSASSAPAFPPCELAEHGQLDFWVGEWDVHWTASNGQSGTGTNRVVRDHSGCVIIERYQDRATTFAGTSIASYQPRLGRWTQWFMGSGNFAYQASGGPAEGAAMELQLVRQSDSQPEARIRFEDVGPESFTWRFQSRTGGGAWTDLTVSRYQRRQPAGPDDS